MLCCAGLIGGYVVGQALGGPWTVIAPAAGFGVGLLVDRKFIHKMHSHPSENNEKETKDNPPAGNAGHT